MGFAELAPLYPLLKLPTFGQKKYGEGEAFRNQGNLTSDRSNSEPPSAVVAQFQRVCLERRP